MTRLWIVRHGNTFEPGETPRRIGARTDLPLVASGRAQARALHDWFAADGVRFDRVLTGPLRRTWETAALIVGDALPVATEPWLDEIDHGPDEGRPEPEVIARIGADTIAAWDRTGEAPHGWTIDRDARIAGWRALMADARGDTLLVTSNGAARFALIAADMAVPSLKLATGAIGVLVRDNHGWSVADWNRRPVPSALPETGDCPKATR